MLSVVQLFWIQSFLSPEFVLDKFKDPSLLNLSPVAACGTDW